MVGSRYEGMKVTTNGLCHLTKIAAMPIYSKNLLLWNQKANDLQLGMQHWLLEYYQICSNDDAGFTLTYFTARSNLVPFVFVWENA